LLLLLVELKLAASRMQSASNKKASLMKQNMREIALSLSEESSLQEEKARIRAESLIRDDNLIVAYEFLQLECELLSERMKLIRNSKSCPPDLVSSISTLVYAAPFLEIPELDFIRKQFGLKYGKKFIDSALDNIKEVHQDRIVSKLSFDRPGARQVQTYLECVCARFDVDWNPTMMVAVTGLDTTTVEEENNDQIMRNKNNQYDPHMAAPPGLVSENDSNSVSSSVTSGSTNPPQNPHYVKGTSFRQ